MILSASENSSEPNELRTDFLGRSVVLTPHRSARPHDFTPAPPEKKQSPSACYFCPGNEKLCPPEIERLDGPSKSWLMRVFPNKFPAFSKSSPKAYGVHEVLVETPKHALTLSQLSDAELAKYLSLIVRRLRSHARDKKIKSTIVFKNEWPDAGASLEHTHTQLVGMSIVPDSLKAQVKLCKSSCPFCLLSIDDKYPKITSSGPFLWLAPYAPRFDHETWIVPKSHSASLTDLDEQAIADLAHTLGVALRTQDVVLNYPAYNLLFHLAPHGQKEFHFHLEITPRTAKWAGFEYTSDIVMASSKPEWTAQEFKEKLQA